MMTHRTTAITLFASTIAAGLGLALTASALSELAAVSGMELLSGVFLLTAGSAFFTGIARRATEHDPATIKLVCGSFAAGVACLWFWLVPAQEAVLTVACHYDNLGACKTVADGDGFAARVARSNDDFVAAQCLHGKQPAYCRLAAARRVVHPQRFCHELNPDDAFEVVEWCTFDAYHSGLVARR